MQYLYIFVFTVLFLFFVLIKGIRKKLTIEKEVGDFRHINEIHKWGERIIIIVVFVMMVLLTFVFTQIELFYSVLGLIMLFGYRAFMEWKYEKETKQYIITILKTFLCIILLIGGLMIIHGIKYTTFEEVIANWEYGKIEENDTVKSIEIVSYTGDSQDNLLEREVLIKKRETIEKIMEQTSGMELKVVDVNKSWEKYYTIDINYESQFARIHVFEQHLFADGSTYPKYEVLGDNGLYQLLENGDFEWVNSD